MRLTVQEMIQCVQTLNEGVRADIWAGQRCAKSGENPVLSVSRDGVAFGLAPLSIFELAGVASISVLSNGKKFGSLAERDRQSAALRLESAKSG